MFGATTSVFSESVEPEADDLVDARQMSVRLALLLQAIC